MKDFLLGRKIHMVALAVAASCAVIGAASAADAGSCYAISDADSRSWCLAKARQDPSACFSIQRQDMRAQCLAEMRK